MFILGQLNPIHGVLLDQYNPILVFILGQLSPVHGVIMGFKEPNIGFGRTFPIWENPLKSQMIPTNSPLLTQFGNFEKFPVHFALAVRISKHSYSFVFRPGRKPCGKGVDCTSGAGVL